MKKTYTKPNMEIVSLTTENVAAEVSGLKIGSNNNTIQSNFTTISYY